MSRDNSDLAVALADEVEEAERRGILAEFGGSTVLVTAALELTRRRAARGPWSIRLLLKKLEHGMCEGLIEARAKWVR